MCGIAGIAGQNIPHREVKKLLIALQERGTDATGVAISDGAGIRVVKNGVAAKKFVTDKCFSDTVKKWSRSGRIALLHTRQATHGTPLDNHNNHPLWNNKGVIIHNGIVWTPKRYETDGETDSEQLLEAITREGFDKALQNASGTYAIAFQWVKEPKHIYLFKHISPLVCGFKNERFYFASTHNILYKAIGKYKAVKLDEDTLYRVTLAPLAIEPVRKIKPKRSHTVWNYGRDYDLDEDGYYLPDYNSPSLCGYC